jgi:hypothetical protein
MYSRQVVEHLEGALIETEYAASDVSHHLSSCVDASYAAKAEAALAALFAAKRLLQEVLATSLRQSAYAQAQCAPGPVHSARTVSTKRRRPTGSPPTRAHAIR